MKIEIRDDSVVIDGYVNAVERYSKVLRDEQGSFVEKISTGAFQRAINRAKKVGNDIKVLLNHDYSKELTSTADSSTKLYEDNIGLRCRCEIRDKDVVEKAKNKKLVGWSFGFIALKEKRDNEEVQHRDVRELELVEVSVLDDTKIPAYNGTSIETRAEIMEDLIELRYINDEIEYEKTPKKQPNNLYEFENRFLELRAN